MRFPRHAARRSPADAAFRAAFVASITRSIFSPTKRLISTVPNALHQCMLLLDIHDPFFIMESSDLNNATRDDLLAELEAMRAIGQEYRLLLDESSDPIFAFFPDGEYRYVNRAFARGVGKKLEDIMSHRIWDVFPKDEADKRFAIVRWVFENGDSRTIEVRVPRAEGDRYYLTTVKPIMDDQLRVISVICISKDITERKHMEDRLAHLAQHDALTDLPNRALFSDRLQKAITQAKRDGTRLALLSIDLDRFKPVNDSFGHHVGDLLLQAVAKRMQECIRESDSVGRIGGDEFLVLLPSVDGADDAMNVAEKIHGALAQPFELPDCASVSISSCIGIALYPDHGERELELLRNADSSMYNAKLQGRNRICVFQFAH
jgi:diguanylate cyclase (GGDEF)-like protein/PAS domain S-box-containing protein